MAEQGIKDSRVLLISSVLIFILSTIIAFRQEPRPDAYTEPKVLSPDWWKYPIEKNAFARLPIVSYGTLNDVFALPHSEKLWVAGEGGLIAHSSDGGKTWERQYPPIEEDDVKGVNQENEQAGIGFSLSKIAYAGEQSDDKKKLIDESRTSYQEAEEIRRSLEFERKQNQNQITEDKKPLPTPIPEQQVSDSAEKEKIFRGSISSIFFTDDKNGWAVGDEGTILHTTDGGKSWKEQDSKTTERFYSVTFTDPNNGWGVGSSGLILNTNDGGKSWRQRNLISLKFNSITFTDEKNGWLVGDKIILHTKDGGENWNPQENIEYLELNSVTFTDKSNGWAVERVE